MKKVNDVKIFTGSNKAITNNEYHFIKTKTLEISECFIVKIETEKVFSYCISEFNDWVSALDLKFEILDLEYDEVFHSFYKYVECVPKGLKVKPKKLKDATEEKIEEKVVKEKKVKPSSIEVIFLAPEKLTEKQKKKYGYEE
jgi:hypothetical protein